MKLFIEDLLRFSKIAIAQIPFEKVDLGCTIKTVCKEINQIIESSEGVVHTNNLPKIEGHSTQLYQLFNNLISNSFKYKKQGVPPIVNIFGTRKDNGYWEIIINDNGIGFDEKYADKIFQPFQRLHGRSKYEGSGLGLSICQKITHGHHGTITAKSILDQGSTFTITLPEKQPETEH